MRIRSFELPAEPPTPRHWYLGSALLTHINNSFCLLLPDGERMVIRSVNRVVDRLEDPRLREEVRTFVGQEAQHARAHLSQCAIYDQQGLPHRPLVAAVGRAYEAFEAALFKLLGERRAAALALALTASFEHYTASWGQIAFAELPQETGIYPPMKRLLLWHCAEEIEHRHVAFDVLRRIDGRYPLRVLGHAFSSLGVLYVTAGSTVYLLWHDDQVTWRRLARELGVFVRHPDNLLVSGIKSFWRYLRPGFHPTQDPAPPAVRPFLAEFEAAAAAAGR